MKKTILWLRGFAETIREVQYAPLILLFFVVIIWMLPAYQSPPKAKKYNVSLGYEDWARYANGLEYTINRLRQSDLPSREVAAITDSVLVPIFEQISKQVGAQYREDLKKDTTKPKKQ